MSYRYEKQFPGIGRVRRMTGLSERGEIEEFNGLIQYLLKTKPFAVELFRDGELSAIELLAAHRNHDLDRLIPDPRVFAFLWGNEGAFERVFMALPQGATVRRYRVSAKKFQGLTDARTVRDLGKIDYQRLSESWPGSPSDYMAFYRMLSQFLTRHFGGKRVGRNNQFRNEVLDMLPRKVERKRVPSITPAVFHRIVARTPDYAQPVFYTLLVTGLRIRSEYMRLERSDLRPATFELEVHGTKTFESQGVIPVAPDCWRWIELAVPCPIAYGQIRKHWMRACLAEGVARKIPDPFKGGRLRYDGPTLHDIRHLTAQFMTNEGVPESVVQRYLRHSDPTTTRRYTTQAVRAEAATALAKAVSQ